MPAGEKIKSPSYDVLAQNARTLGERENGTAQRKQEGKLIVLK
jgi:hypothetical protein